MSADNQESSDRLRSNLNAKGKTKELIVNLSDAYNGWWGVPYLIGLQSLDSDPVPEEQAGEEKAEIEAQEPALQNPAPTTSKPSKVTQALRVLRAGRLHL